MKHSLLKLVIFFSLTTVTNLVACPKQQVDLWEQTLKNSSSWDSKKTVTELSLGLRNMGYRQRQSVHLYEEELTYKKFQQKIISIPNHARIIADEFEEQRKNDQGGDGSLRFYYFEGILSNLPSPETVVVLGAYLDDFRDTDTPNLPIEQQVIIDRSPQYGVIFTSDLPWMATYSIAKLGLRDPPLGEDKLENYTVTPLNFSPKPTEQWKKTRAWYQEVKAGKRAFSFRGQSVEYRLEPDGTWDTIPIENPPDDAILYPVATKEQLAKFYTKPVYVPPLPAIAKKPEENKWAWIVGIIIILFGITWWIRLKKHKWA